MILGVLCDLDLLIKWVNKKRNISLQKKIVMSTINLTAPSAISLNAAQQKRLSDLRNALRNIFHEV